MIYVRALPFIIFRDYPDYGYLTDNRNMGYDTASHSGYKVGDLLISKTGSIFYLQIQQSYQSIEQIADRLLSIFENVSKSQVLSDARDFYLSLGKQGFVQISETPNNDSDYPVCFSYDNRNPIILPETAGNDAFVFDDAFGGEYRLTRVHIDVSSLCNERCIHCYIPNRNKRGVMSEVLFNSIVEQCRAINVINITISGGEPLMNSNIIPFLRKCRELNFSINLLTNLTLLTDELIEEFTNNPLLSIQTSLYALKEDVHDQITGKIGSFTKTMNAILTLHAKNVPMQINCPILKQNIHEYKDVIQWALDRNIESSCDFMLYGCYDSSLSNLACRLNLSEADVVLTEICKDEIMLQRMIASIKEKRIGQQEKICPVCQSSLCISNNGDVYPCEGWQRLKIGNVNEISIQKIWNESPVVSKLRNLKYQDFPKCSFCQNKKYCTTCLIMNANEDPNGNYSQVNTYMCEVAKLKKHKLQSYL